MNIEDILADKEMYFSQIIHLIDLILNQNNLDSENILTPRDLAELGKNKINKLN